MLKCRPVEQDKTDNKLFQLSNMFHQTVVFFWIQETLKNEADIRWDIILGNVYIHKNNSKNCLQILKAIAIKNKKPAINKIAFTTSINILNAFNN